MDKKIILDILNQRNHGSDRMTIEEYDNDFPVRADDYISDDVSNINRKYSVESNPIIKEVENRNKPETSSNEIIENIRNEATSNSATRRFLSEALDSTLDSGTSAWDALSTVSNSFASIFAQQPGEDVFDRITYILADMIHLVPSITATTLTITQGVTNIVGNIVTGATGFIGGVIGGIGNMFKSGFSIRSFQAGYDGGSSQTLSFMEPINNMAKTMTHAGSELLQSTVQTYTDWAADTLRAMSDTFSNVYHDGVSETKFGIRMEESWQLFLKENNTKLHINNYNNPIANLGTDPIIFGAPPRYNTLSDPRDRSYMNTFIKDGNIISIMPGKPKYNGLSLSLGQTGPSQGISKLTEIMNQGNKEVASFFKSISGESGTNNKWNQGILSKPNEAASKTFTPQEYAKIALSYLKQNGISDYFNEYDKRYYTFQPAFDDYYSYLETMLNTIYIRMGLGEKLDGKTELFSFFNNPDSTNPQLLNMFSNKALGFYSEGPPAISESSSNDTSDPAGLKSTADSMADEFQKYNYITGFGIKGNRRAAISVARMSSIGTNFKEAFGQQGPFSSIIPQLSEGSGLVRRTLDKAYRSLDKGLGMTTYAASTDLNAITESLMSTNGMKTSFPTLWSDSNYSKSITVDFEFISPYGDPLSIFQHVYTPLAALLSLALPRQAEENAYVNPFFLRLDIPGVISSDFAIISNITWVRGGSHNLWTVDKHPRAITVSVTFEDLYQFMAMTKRVSYLAANPNYSMFLDSFSGIRSLYRDGDGSIGNDYWNELVNRLNSENKSRSGLWNETEVDKRINQYIDHNHLNNADADRIRFFSNYYKRDLSWMKSVS